MMCYSQLNFVNADLWPQVLAKLSKGSEWRVMAYLVLGPDLDEKRFEEEEAIGKTILSMLQGSS